MLDYFFKKMSFNSDIIKRTIKTKKMVLAMLAEVPEIPPKPKMAAIIAIMMKIMVQRNMY